MQSNIREIIGFPSYEISDLGVVRNIKTNHNVSISRHKQGHHVVRLWNNGETKLFNLYRLMAIHFIPNPENKREVNHIDGDRYSFPVLSNLEWVTPSENMKHAVKNGLAKKQFKPGDEHSLCKIKKEDSNKIKSLRISGVRTMEIAEMFGISQRHVYTICKS